MFSDQLINDEPWTIRRSNSIPLTPPLASPSALATGIHMVTIGSPLHDPKGTYQESNTGESSFGFSEIRLEIPLHALRPSERVQSIHFRNRELNSKVFPWKRWWATKTAGSALPHLKSVEHTEAPFFWVTTAKQNINYTIHLQHMAQ